MADADIERPVAEEEAGGGGEGEEGEEEDEDDEDEDGIDEILPFAGAAGLAAAGASNRRLDNKMRLYGAIQEHMMRETGEMNQALKKRKRMNCVPVLLSIFLPWLLCLFIYALNAFEAHYIAPITTTCITLGTLVASVLYYRKGSRTWNEGEGNGFYQYHLGATFIAATVISWVLGDLTFWSWMQPVYNIQHLATYTNIDPSSQIMSGGDIMPTSGKRYQDAGKMFFDHHAIVDTSKSMSFKMGRLYCVAPIINPECQYNCGNDFWAVGVDCCGEDAANFNCGDVKNPHTKSGLRYMVDAFRPYFRLAVLEAEGVHGLMSAHPIFVEWLSDPNEEVRIDELKGYRLYMVWMIVAFVVNAIWLACVVKWARVNVDF